MAFKALFLTQAGTLRAWVSGGFFGIVTTAVAGGFTFAGICLTLNSNEQTEKLRLQLTYLPRVISEIEACELKITASYRATALYFDYPEFTNINSIEVLFSEYADGFRGCLDSVTEFQTLVHATGLKRDACLVNLKTGIKTLRDAQMARFRERLANPGGTLVLPAVDSDFRLIVQNQFRQCEKYFEALTASN